MKLGIYRHYKGKLYEVIGTVIHSETLKELVLYRSVEGSEEYPKETLWVRPRDMFEESILDNGNTKLRFEFISVELCK